MINFKTALKWGIIGATFVGTAYVAGVLVYRYLTTDGRVIEVCEAPTYNNVPVQTKPFLLARSNSVDEYTVTNQENNENDPNKKVNYLVSEWNVSGHTRTISEGQKASATAKNNAEQDGVVLEEGQTYVRPYECHRAALA